jgi:hypothetical protein
VTPSTVLSGGDYTWRLRGWNSSQGHSLWSDPLAFTVVGATGISPTGTIADSTPTYFWNEVSGATWYYLQVLDALSAPVVSKWYSSAVCSGGTCSATPSTALPNGDYTWAVRPWSAAQGHGAWSASLNFTVDAGAGAPRTRPLAAVTINKAGTGMGTILAGSQECGVDCPGMTIPYADFAELTVIPADGSSFVRCETTDGRPLPAKFQVKPGDTILVIFERKP